jgi:hypothetical protein
MFGMVRLFWFHTLHPLRRFFAWSLRRLIHQIQRPPEAGEHPQPKHIDLEHAHGLDVVLVPLDDGAVGHAGVLDGDALAQGAAGHDKAADVLGEVAREAEDLPRESEGLAQGRVVGVDAEFAEAIRK